MKHARDADSDNNNKANLSPAFLTVLITVSICVWSMLGMWMLTSWREMVLGAETFSPPCVRAVTSCRVTLDDCWPSVTMSPTL